MIYDSFAVEGNCKGCGKPTECHINGDYPVCMERMTSFTTGLIKQSDNYELKCVGDIGKTKG